MSKHVDELVNNGINALTELKKLSQEDIDKIVHEMAIAVLDKHMYLAKLAVEETGRGIYEDKAIKNMYATEEIWNNIKNLKTVGIIEEDEEKELKYVAEPLGVICGVTPTTNPTSTTIFKTLISIKTRNPIIFAFHPSAQRCSSETLNIMYEAGLKFGLPINSLQYIHEPSLENTSALMNHSNIATILATGGSAMVKSAYSSGNPALGVGPGNTPSYIEKSANIKRAVNDLILSKSFDNGMICASEQATIVDKEIYKEVINEFAEQNAYIVSKKEIKKLENAVMNENKTAVNPNIVGKSAKHIAHLAGITVPEETNILLVELENVGEKYPLSLEKLSPILAIIKSENTNDAFNKCHIMLKHGAGHTACIHTTDYELAEKFGLEMEACRILINQPTAIGGIGDLYNNLTPSLTLGCGSYGKNSVSHNVGAMDLLNIKTIANRRNNMQWSKVPSKIYFEKNSVNYLKEMDLERVFIVADKSMVNLGFVTKVESVLKQNPKFKEVSVFFDVEPDPSTNTVMKGSEQMKLFKPDTIIAVGGGSVMDASKGMKIFYDEPDSQFFGAKQKFLDIRKRTYKFPDMSKTKLVCIPTTSSTGSEVTAFAVITDSETHVKYPLADYAITPDVAIVDSKFVETVPKKVVAEGGMDTLCHAIESYVSTLASDYTKGLSLQAIKLVFENLKNSYEGDLTAKHKMHDASTIAGEAFTSALLGINHSLAHKLGGEFGLAHGRCISTLMPLVIKYNSEKPTKRAIWAKYEYARAIDDYVEIAKSIGIYEKTKIKTVDKLIEKIIELGESVDVSFNFESQGINKEIYMEKAYELAELAFEDNCTISNPRQPLISELEEIIIKAY